MSLTNFKDRPTNVILQSPQYSFLTQTQINRTSGP